MEPAQINQAQDEYDATIGDQEVYATSTYDLARQLHPDEFRRDEGDYLICLTDGQAMTLQTYINAALKAERDGDTVLFDWFAKDVGRMVISNFSTVINELHRKDLL